MPLRATSAVALLLLSLVMSGCSGKPDLAGDGSDDDLSLTGSGSMLWTYGSPSPDGAPYVRDFDGLANHPSDPASPDFMQGLPGGPSMGSFQTCCLYSWVRAPDLLEMGQMSVLRVTLNWTNDQQNNANLDVALCVIWYCGFPDMPDQSNLPGAHSESFNLISGGREEFNGWYGDGVPTVGARYSNGVFSTGLAFTVHVEVVPVGDALAFLDPYEVTVPANSTLQAELAGPIRGTDLSAGLMVYGESDYPIAYHELSGDDGSLHDLGHGEGTYVVAPFSLDGAVLRMKVNSTVEPAPLRLLQETFADVLVAPVTDPAQRSGAFRFEAPPGSLDTFPFFIAETGAQVANGPTTRSVTSLTSSSGLVADVRGSLVGTQIPQVGNVCFICSTSVEWNPQNYLDDDGTYDVAYDTVGATGRFVLFTATYSR